MNCPKCENEIPEAIMKFLTEGINQLCPSCKYLLTGEELGLIEEEFEKKEVDMKEIKELLGEVDTIVDFKTKDLEKKVNEIKNKEKPELLEPEISSSTPIEEHKIGKVSLSEDFIKGSPLEAILCPECKKEMPKEVIEKLKTGEYASCPACNHILKGELLGIMIRKKKIEKSTITELAHAAQKKKKRKLLAYYCPHCNDPKSKLTENQLNLIEMGMVVECKVCGQVIKNEHLKL